MKHICKACGTEFDYPKKDRKYCNRACLFSKVKPPILNGKNHPNWTGGKVKHGNYIFINNPTHPYANARNEVREHRLIMEKKIDRYLLPNEVVHHIDGDSLNNNPENLQLFNSQKEHASFERRFK